MQRTSITLPLDLGLELMSVVNAKNKTEAVILAVRDEIRKKKKEQLQDMAGKIEFTISAEELRHGDHRLG
ncbi:MAG: DUF2191 domain-containing protein [Desulfobacterales bacterium CG2_30_60_27]|nr:MAG: DUF2191 domain-containing protein [Desulfobacterales bacterium CG2_30_60_27]